MGYSRFKQKNKKRFLSAFFLHAGQTRPVDQLPKIIISVGALTDGCRPPQPA
jgi:hypothetical protein